MSIQYSKNTKLTLPSVEDWGSDLGILKDPSSGKFTRQKWYVSDTQDITKMIDDSGDRAAEAINTYARGINPMASISYDNNTNNAGVFRNGMSSSGIQASSVNKLGVFRPPVFTNRDLLPLSRLPRAHTSIAGIAEKTDWTKTKFNQEEFRQIKKEVLDVPVRPTVTSNQKNIQISEPFQLKYNIITDNKIKYGAESGTKILANLPVNSSVQTKGIDEDYSGVYARTNLTDNNFYVKNDFILDEDHYIQDSNTTSAYTNISDNLKPISLYNNADFNINVKDDTLYTKDFVTNIQGYNRDNIDNINEDDISLNKVLPSYSTRTNISDNKFYRNITSENDLELERNVPLVCLETNKSQYDNPNNMVVTAREYNRLASTLSLGGFEGKQSIPKIIRQEETTLNPDKRKLIKSAGESYRQRFADY